jgi:hypothetical protein
MIIINSSEKMFKIFGQVNLIYLNPPLNIQEIKNESK